MQKPQLPQSELKRLEVLKRYSVLDTMPEKAFDNISLLASQICGTPIALVSLLDENRQWFKSRVGLDASETPREFSFCGHAILQKEIFEIPNADLDSRFADNPLVTDKPRVVFYAGAPLKTPSGEQIGTLCVIDHEPRKLTTQQTASLVALAEQVVALLELRLTVAQLVDEREMREQFVSTLTHDLRNPLAAAKMGAQLLARKASTGEALQIGLRRVDANIDRADRMILDLLDTTRIKAGEGIPVNRSKCDLVPIVAATMTQFSELHSVQVRVELPSSPMFGFWDRSTLERALENLLGNAVKYGDNKHPITLTLRSDNNEAVLAVHNFGPPITAADQETLFMPFHRTQSAVQSGKKGWGIGLTLVRAVASAHNGSAGVQSSSESGTTFFLRLPLSN